MNRYFLGEGAGHHENGIWLGLDLTDCLVVKSDKFGESNREMARNFMQGSIIINRNGYFESQVWQCMPVVPAPGKLREENWSFKASTGEIASLRLA